MDKEIFDSIVDYLIDICNRNKLSVAESCACIAAATYQALYSIFRSAGINDRDVIKVIKEYINNLLQITIDFNNKNSGLDSYS